MSVWRHVQASDSPAPSGSYSQAVVANGLLFLAGMGPYDPTTREVVGDTIEAQTAQVIHNIRAVLRAEGCDLKNVVNVTAYLEDLRRDWEGFDTVYGRAFSPPYPARTAVGASLKRMLVELSVVAVLPAGAADGRGPAFDDGARALDSDGSVL